MNAIRSFNLSVSVGSEEKFWIPPLQLDGLYNSHGVYGSSGEHLVDSLTLPDWCAWADAGSAVTFAALYSATAPHLEVFSNRTRNHLREDMRGYKPATAHLGEMSLQSEQTTYNQNTSNFPTIALDVVGGVSVHNLYEVVSLDTGDRGTVSAVLSTGMSSMVEPSVVERINNLTAARVG